MHPNKKKDYGLSAKEKRTIEIFEKPYVSKFKALEQAGISVNEFNKLMQNPSFKGYLTKRRNLAFDEELERLKPLFGRALDVVNDILHNASSDGLKLKAASMIMDITLQWRKESEVEDKIRVLEKKAGIHNEVIDVEQE